MKPAIGVSAESWIEYIEDHPEIRAKRADVVEKIMKMYNALKAGRKVTICIPVVSIDGIAVFGEMNDVVDLNDLGTMMFIEDLERAEVKIQ
jgi:hypothetical protein